MDNTTLFRTSGQDRSFDASLVVLYARVSSREQAKEGFSIPAQLKLLREYAAQQGLSVLKQYVDVETAKQTGRVEFGKMVVSLETHPRVRTILVEKTDRLYRNFKDFVVLEDLEVHTHMVKEGVVLSPDSRSSEKLIHGIKVVMAKNHIDNLSEETRKGMLEKAEQGVYPSAAPLGYRNVESSEGKRVIAPDPEVAPIVMQLYEWYAAGGLALRDLSRKARQAGFAHRKSGHMVPTGTIHKILRSRLDMGEFVWKGKIYKGKHQPLVSRELWDRVQDMLDSRPASKHRQVKHDFAFSGPHNLRPLRLLPGR